MQADSVCRVHTLQLRPSEVFDDIRPVWRVIVSSQVWFQFPTQNLEGSTLANTVGSYQTKHLSGAGGWQSVELEAVGGVSVGDLRFEIGWQIDDIDSSKWAFLWTDTASNAKTLRDEGNF